jgi:hypothetical protein
MDFSILLLQVSRGFTAAIFPDILRLVNLESFVLLLIYTRSKLGTQTTKSLSTVTSYISATSLIEMCSIFVTTYCDGTVSFRSMYVNLTAYPFRQAQAEKQELPLLLSDSVSQGTSLAATQIRARTVRSTPAYRWRKRDPFHLVCLSVSPNDTSRNYSLPCETS